MAELERGLEYASDKELEAMAKATNASMASTFSMIFAVHEDISSEEASIKGFCAASFFKIEPTKKAIIGYFQRAVDSTPEEFFEILKDNKEEFRECIEKPRL